MKALGIIISLCVAGCATAPRLVKVMTPLSFAPGTDIVRVVAGVADVEIRYEDLYMAMKISAAQQGWRDKLEAIRGKTVFRYDADAGAILAAVLPDLLERGQVVVRDARSGKAEAFVLKGAVPGGGRYYCLPDGTDFLFDFPLTITPFTNQKPNKAPEPTPTAVTPRAIE